MPKPSEQSPLITSGQAARILGVTVRTLVRWTNEGRVTCVRTLGGGHRRYVRADIEQLGTAHDTPEAS